MSFKKLLIIIIIAVGAFMFLFLWHSHKVGIEQGRNERHWLKDLLGTGSEDLSLMEEELSAGEEQFPGWEGDEETAVKKEIQYISFDQITSILGTDRFQKFKKAFEENDILSKTKYTEVTLYPDQIDNGKDNLIFYVFINDEPGSKFQITYQYGTDLFEIKPIPEFPGLNTENNDNADQAQPSDGMTDEDVEGDGDVTSTPPAPSASESPAPSTDSSSSSSGSSSSDTTTETVVVKNYYTVNGVEFENVDIYSVLSEEAVNLFTQQVTSWWSSTGESRRTIRTSTPVKNGSKVTFTVEYVNGGGSFTATLDLNQETFTFG